MNDPKVSQLPRGGRIGSFVKILQKKFDEDIVLRIVEDAEKYDTMAAEQKSGWWRTAVGRMEQELGI